MAVFLQEGRVRWSETDASGLFHYPSALIWAEEAEHALYRTTLPGFRFDNLPRRSVTATYSAPFRAGDGYAVKIWVEKLGNSSLTFGWTILRGETVAVEGQHTAINLGADFRPAPFPDELRAGLTPYLKSNDA